MEKTNNTTTATAAKTTVARDRAYATLPFSKLFSALGNECEAKLTALDAATDARIVKIQAEADAEIRKIQAVADEKIRVILSEAIDEAARIIRRMGKRLNKVATKAINRMSSEDLAILITASIEAENERAREAEQEAVVESQEAMSDQKPTNCYDPEGMD